jgi:hypothetical protein
MKNICFYDSPKYKKNAFVEIENNIFRNGELYCTSIRFQQEPELGEGASAGNISQYPLEDILDSTGTYVHDFYEDLNTDESSICFLELASSHVENIRSVTALFGKHVYNKTKNKSVELIIE